MTGGRAPTLRPETALLGMGVACWVLASLHFLKLFELGGWLVLSLYSYYSLAAALGWLSGNVLMLRRRQFPGATHQRLQSIYWLGPLGFLFLVWALTPRGAQQLAPFVPLYAVGVYSVLFLVPILLGRARHSL